MKKILEQLRKSQEYIDSISNSQEISEQEKINADNAWTAIFQKAWGMADTKEKLEELMNLTPLESIARSACLLKIKKLENSHSRRLACEFSFTLPHLFTNSNKSINRFV